MTQRKHASSIVAMVLVTAVAGCGGYPQPSDFRANYFAAVQLGRDLADVFAIYDDDGEGTLPDMEEAAKVSVNGLRLPLTTGGDGNFMFDSRVPAVEPGAPYEFVLDLPSGESVSRSISAVQPADITSPAPDSTLSISEDNRVEWSSTAPGESDWVFLLIPGVFTARMIPITRSFVPVTAADGEAGVTVPASALREWLQLAGSGATGPDIPLLPLPVAAQLVLARARAAPNSPPFGEGEIVADADISAVQVTLTP